jgi:hypothetical protein
MKHVSLLGRPNAEDKLRDQLHRLFQPISSFSSSKGMAKRLVGWRRLVDPRRQSGGHKTVYGVL